MRRWVAPCLVLPLLAGGLSARAAVKVDAYTQVVLGRQGEISADMFGITAFEGFPMVIADRDYRARVAALRPGCIRFGGSLSWFAPPTYDPAWYASPEAAREFEQTLLFGSRYPLGRFAPVVRQMGAEPMVSLGSPPPYLTEPGTHNPSDFAKWATYCVAYIGLWKKFDPHLRLVQIWNEPNAHWYRDPRVKAEGISAAQLHIRMAIQVARAMKQRFPDLQVGGPVLCWPPAWPPDQKGMKPWYTWYDWTLPWLQQTKDTIDFFDFHVYNVSPEDFAVQAEMLENQAQITQGRRLPIWITESNYDLKPAELNDPVAIWHKRMLPYERLLLQGMLPQADKVAGNLYHDLHARLHTLLPRGADDPDPTYWLLWILRDLRGQRIVADSSDPEVLTFATLEQDRVTVVIFNDSAQSKRVPLQVTMPCGYWTGPAVRAIGQSPAGACQRLKLKPQVTRHGNQAQCVLQLPARATVSLNFRLDHFPQLHRRRLWTEYFGDRTLQLLKPDRPEQVMIKAPPVGNAKAFLRVGLLGATGQEKLAARLNGKDLAVNPLALQNIPLPATGLQAENTFELSLRQPANNPRLALAFASIVFEQTR